MAAPKKRKVIAMFPTDMIAELEKMGEVSFDSRGYCRGFSGYVQRMYRRTKR